MNHLRQITNSIYVIKDGGSNHSNDNDDFFIYSVEGLYLTGIYMYSIVIKEIFRWNQFMYSLEIVGSISNIYIRFWFIEFDIN